MSSREKNALTLIKGSSSAVIVSVLSMGAMFFLHVLLARLMGASQYSIYAYVLTWVSIFVMVGGMGMRPVTVRYASQYTAKEQYSPLKGLMQRSSEMVICFTSALALAVLVGVNFFQGELEPHFFISIKAGALLVPITALSMQKQSFLRGLKHIVSAMIPLEVVKPVALCCLVLVVSLLMPAEIKAAQVIALNVAATCIAYGILAHISLNKTKEKLKGVSPEFETRKWLAMAFPLIILSGMNALHRHIDVLMLGWFIDVEHAGAYTVAGRIAGFIGFGLVSVNVIIAPMISEMYAKDNQSELQAIVTMGVRASAVVGISIALVVVIGGKALLGLFGRDFLFCYSALVLLSLGEIINCLMGSVMQTMNMTGREKMASIIFGGTVILNIILNIIWIPKWGVAGAAMATATSKALWNIVLSAYVWKKMHIKTWFRLKT